MKWCAVICGLFITASTTLGQQPEPPVKKGFVVHEWGVFRVNENAGYANADIRAEWDDLPQFVYGHIKGRAVPQHWGAAEFRRRPIIFFHATEPITARLKINFPGGMAGVWYPATEEPAVFGNQKQPQVGASLNWNLGIKQCPDGWRPKHPVASAVSEKHWIARIRQVKADEVFARYSPNPLDVEREKFIYYDGIFPQGKWLKIAVEKDAVSLTSRVKHPVFDVTVVDRRGDKVRVGRIGKMEAGETVKEITFTDVDASRFSSEAAATLLKQLTVAGLFEDEASSLVDLWKKEMFETPGLNLFYRLPQAEYDARLPMVLTPKPESLIRVGLVFHPHVEPDFAERILELARQLDAPRFAVRDAAVKKLVLIGPAALVELQRLRESKDVSVEVRERIDSVVKKWNAKEAFEP